MQNVLPAQFVSKTALPVKFLQVVCIRIGIRNSYMYGNKPSKSEELTSPRGSKHLGPHAVYLECPRQTVKMRSTVAR